VKGERWRYLAWGVCAAAVALHAMTAFVMSAGAVSASTLGFFALSCAPYLAMLALATWLKQPIPGAAGASAAMLADVTMFWSVFIQPKGSTAALGLLVMPFWNLLVIAPAVAAAAYLFTRGPKRDSHLV
jgi:hypothetical protein